MNYLFELLLAHSLREVQENRPDNFFVLPANSLVWQDVFKKCAEENMVVGIEFTTADQNQLPIRDAILRLARQFNRRVIFLRAPIGAFGTYDQVEFIV